MNQEIAPLLEFARDYLRVNHAPFYMPGHKRGQGIDPEFADLIGNNLFRLDLPELPGLPEAIAVAQELAANAYGADRTWFLVNGSTCGIEAMLLATCQPGDKILLGRNCHKAAIAALILSGAVPVYLETSYDATLDLDLGVTPSTLRSALEAHPEAKAAFVVSPNYFGVCGEIEELVAIAHDRSIPLLVDAAHGAHLHFHPDLPISAVAAGADLVVQSTHKVNAGLTQASMLHLRGNLVGGERVSQALQLVQSTSPSLLLLTSLDVARRQMAVHGKELLGQTLALAEWARSQIHNLPNLDTFDRQQIPTLDPTRLTVMVDRLGITGFDADAILYEQLGVMAEMPTLRQLVFILTFGNTSQDIERLVRALIRLEQARRGQSQGKGLAFVRQSGHQTQEFMTNAKPQPQISPREAFFAKRDRVEFKLACDRISTEIICPYPPGIPVICPGEVITRDAIDFVLAIKQAGGTVNGSSDPTLETIGVVAHNS
ncbi:aminotransferase class I/II-fold pyridoxal phosphate-dependent enzyme [Pseudanabaena sp. PCC 6802]|uniref:aminotransferase class I/II-fold pyridoxal phosphate-dependent enzyme n=1 Tax=Pseudanabaena sp. PCC 6802 TaxID=118173 RepID=UPI00034621E2|nr:aminotransferase class V-fold PLP-dependent enzyme [Pseudanabaena sp. PCC 6802]